jgi:outer membrane protein assembly factor BamB
VALKAHDVSGTCLPTARLLACSVAPAGVVARSAATGKVAWSVAAGAATGHDPGLAIDGNRAVTAGGRTIRAADLTRGSAAWTRTLPAGRLFGRPAAADGIVYAATYGATYTDPQILYAYRASNGAKLWQKESTDLHPLAMGSRVYTAESGGQVVSRDGKTGAVLATSEESHPCPGLMSGAGYLVCASNRSAAGDTFPPVTLIDPKTLKVVRTLWQPGDKPAGGVITSGGILVLRADNAEDPSTGEWLAFDLRTGDKLWESDGTSSGTGDSAVLVGTRVVWMSQGRLISVDPRKGPQATGADKPRYSPQYPEADAGRSGSLTAYGTHIILKTQVKPALRSVTAP